MIKIAEIENLNTVYTIVHSAISETFPNYYPQVVVDFLLDYHSRENIKQDILLGCIYLLFEENTFVGTGTFKEKEISQVFILPDHQGRGYGTQIMDFLESQVFIKYDKVCLEASFSVLNFYLKRGYNTIENVSYPIGNEQVFSYLVMEKHRIPNVSF